MYLGVSISIIQLFCSRVVQLLIRSGLITVLEWAFVIGWLEEEDVRRKMLICLFHSHFTVVISVIMMWKETFCMFVFLTSKQNMWCVY